MRSRTQTRKKKTHTHTHKYIYICIYKRLIISKKLKFLFSRLTKTRNEQKRKQQNILKTAIYDLFSNFQFILKIYIKEGRFQKIKDERKLCFHYSYLPYDIYIYMHRTFSFST
jgi:hypothetical protein